MDNNINQQLEQFTEDQLQVFLSGRFGDGCITTTNTNSTYYSTNCKFKEYLLFKQKLLGNMAKNISYTEKNGYIKLLYIL